MMAPKPTTSAGYPPELATEARRMCLYVATILGDLFEDVVVVGGLVPYLIVEQDRMQQGQRHVGTRDLDLGLSLAALDDGRYREIAERLRDAEPVATVAARFDAIADAPEATSALAMLAEDFASPGHLGPRRRAEFLGDRGDEHLAEAFALVAEFLRLVR